MALLTGSGSGVRFRSEQGKSSTREGFQLSARHLLAQQAGYDGAAFTAPEAARVIARTLALTCADCTNGGGGSGGRSAHVPDHHLSGLGWCQTIA